MSERIPAGPQRAVAAGAAPSGTADTRWRSSLRRPSEGIEAQGVALATFGAFREMDAARASGRRPVLFVFYAGHGDIGAGDMGQVYLRPAGSEPGPGVAEALSGADLRSLVLQRSRAERVRRGAGAVAVGLLPVLQSRRTSLRALGTVVPGGQARRRYLAAPDAAGAHHVITLEPTEGGARLAHRVF